MKPLRVFLASLLYCFFWLPLGLVTQGLADWLCRRRPRSTAWRARAGRLNAPEHLREPF